MQVMYRCKVLEALNAADGSVLYTIEQKQQQDSKLFIRVELGTLKEYELRNALEAERKLRAGRVSYTMAKVPGQPGVYSLICRGMEFDQVRSAIDLYLSRA